MEDKQKIGFPYSEDLKKWELRPETMVALEHFGVEGDELLLPEQYHGYLPLLAHIDGMLRTEQIPIHLAIDGPCASGKTTLGRFLEKIYHCGVIHMDDFFLPAAQRTETRMSEIGGNMDSERFQTEVLTPMEQGNTICYQPWDCKSQSFGPERWVEVGRLLVVEGAYSLHPCRRKRYSCRVWLEAPIDQRLQRLLKREGEEGLKNFQKHWIPRENLYFDQCRVKDCCSIVLEKRQPE